MAVIDGERRVVSVLMADIADSTAIGERLGPERSKFLFDEGRRYNALGDTVNVTARLQALSSQTEVTLGPQTAAQVRGCFELEELGETPIRGREAPIDSFRVLSELEPMRRRPSEPLVGR